MELVTAQAKPAQSLPVEIKARDLRVRFGAVQALALPDLSVSGRIIALIGENGAGKSTFMKALLGLTPIEHGELYATQGGQRLLIERDVAFCPEHGAVIADVSVESYLSLWCRLRWGRADYFKRDGAWVMEALLLEPLLTRLGRELSKGERRRVQIGVGFLMRPKLFLLDEPFDGLDLVQTERLVRLVRVVGKTTNMLISSHRLDVLSDLTADGLLLVKGGGYALGTPAELSSAFFRDVNNPIVPVPAISY